MTIAVSFSVPFENPGLKEVQCRLRIWFVGVGALAATAALEACLLQERPTLLVISGFAGALNPRFLPGAAFLCENWSDPKTVQTLISHGWQPPPKAHLHTSKDIAATVGQKTHLRSITGSDLVDMETEALFQIARSQDIPTLTIRAVSDAATTDLPVPEHLLYDISRQCIRPIALCTYLLTHPNRIWPFLDMLRDLSLARAQLKIHLRSIFRVASNCL